MKNFELVQELANRLNKDALNHPLIRLEKDVFQMVENDDHPEFETVDEGEWVQDGKSQWREKVVQEISTGRYYKLMSVRTGSPFTEWCYDYYNTDLAPTRKIIKVKEEWE